MKTLLSLFLFLTLNMQGAIIFYTDKPNSVPVDSDFFSLQRNRDYINSSGLQMKGYLFSSPLFTGTATSSGNFVVQGILYGNGGGLTNIGGLNFLPITNGNGTNESFWGVTFFQEIDALNFYPTNMFTGLTNVGTLGTDGNGKLTIGSSTVTNLSVTNLYVTFETNNTFVNTNLFISTSNSFFNNTYITNVYINTATNNTFVNSNVMILTSNAIFTVKRGATVVFETNAFLIDSNITANSAVITDSIQNITNAANAHGVFTNSSTGPPSFGLLQNTEMQNSSITIQGSAVALGGSTLAAGSSPAFSGINFTNMNYVVNTNNGGGNALVGGANGTAATLYLTNITTATTLASFTWPTTYASGIKLYCTCSGGTDRILTFPNGCTGAGYGTPPAITVTNGKAAYFDIVCVPGVSTNVFWSPVF